MLLYRKPPRHQYVKRFEPIGDGRRRLLADMTDAERI